MSRFPPFPLLPFVGCLIVSTLVRAGSGGRCLTRGYGYDFPEVWRISAEVRIEQNFGPHMLQYGASG